MAVITLNPENDTYVSLTPGDQINGVGGNDTLTASDGGNQLYGGDGNDVLNGGGGSDLLVGDSFSNFIYSNIIRGFGGHDTIVSLSTLDAVYAGAGNDTVTSFAQQTSQVLDGGIGQDTLEMSALVNVNLPVNVTFGAIFVFTIGAVSSATYMNFESLRVTLGTGANTVVGSSGNDRILTGYLNGTNATVQFDAGFVRAGQGDDQVAFNGLARVGSGIQRMSGGTGQDSLTWTGGEAAIADLTIDAASGNMFANGLRFATFDNFETLNFRTFEAITGAFGYTGISGADILDIDALSAVINTLGGNDSISIGINSGGGTVSGGTGDDLLRSEIYNTSAITLNGDQGNDTVQGGGGVAILNGGDGNDVIQSSNSHSQLFGGNGNDTLSISFDQIHVGTGNVLIDGGAGRDVLDVTLLFTNANLTLDLSTPTITLANGAIITGVEGIRLISSFGNDDITASNDARGAAFNTVYSSFGNDTLRASANGASLDGASGNDMLFGAAGDDVLIGGSSADTMRGGAGNDRLIGGTDRDFMVGGIGGDVFALLNGFESGITALARDLIVDFTKAEGDRIDLAAIDAVVLAGPIVNDAFDFIGTTAFGNVAGELRSEKVNLAGTVNDHTLISGDTNGDGVADFTIEVRGLITFVAADFIL